MTTSHTYKGETLTSKQWAAKLGISVGTFHNRVKTLKGYPNKIFSKGLIVPRNGPYQFHGYSGTTTYTAWRNMLARCLNKTDGKYPRYGGRGIKICKRWMKFKNFVNDMGECPVGLTLERKDNDGDYCPTNCIWATYKEQARNNSRNRKVFHEGVLYKSLIEFAEAKNLDYVRLKTRLAAGVPFERAINPSKLTAGG